MTMCRIAEATFAPASETEEALRIFREEALPVFERIGDVARARCDDEQDRRHS